MYFYTNTECSNTISNWMFRWNKNIKTIGRGGGDNTKIKTWPFFLIGNDSFLCYSNSGRTFKSAHVEQDKNFRNRKKCDRHVKTNKIRPCQDRQQFRFILFRLYPRNFSATSTYKSFWHVSIFHPAIPQNKRLPLPARHGYLVFLFHPLIESRG